MCLQAATAESYCPTRWFIVREMFTGEPDTNRKLLSKELFFKSSKSIALLLFRTLFINLADQHLPGAVLEVLEYFRHTYIAVGREKCIWRFLNTKCSIVITRKLC